MERNLEQTVYLKKNLNNLINFNLNYSFSSEIHSCFVGFFAATWSDRNSLSGRSFAAAGVRTEQKIRKCPKMLSVLFTRSITDYKY